MSLKKVAKIASLAGIVFMFIATSTPVRPQDVVNQVPSPSDAGLDLGVGSIVISAVAALLASGIGWLGKTTIEGFKSQITEYRQQAVEGIKNCNERVTLCERAHQESSTKLGERQRDLELDVVKNYVHVQDHTRQLLVLHAAIEKLGSAQQEALIEIRGLKSDAAPKSA